MVGSEQLFSRGVNLHPASTSTRQCEHRHCSKGRHVSSYLEEPALPQPKTPCGTLVRGASLSFFHTNTQEDPMILV
jgi:hypothetical protein